MTDADRLVRLVQAGYPCVRIVTQEHAEAADVVLAAAVALKKSYRRWSAVSGVRDGLFADKPGTPETTNLGAAAVWLATHHAEGVTLLMDAGAAMANDHVATRAWRELVDAKADRGGLVVMIDSAETAAPAVTALTHPFELTLPDEEALGTIVKAAIRDMHKKSPVNADMTRADFQTVIRNLRGLTRRQARQVIQEVIAEDRSFNIYDLNSILAKKRQMLHTGGLLEYVKSPVDMNAIGGLDRLKGWLSTRSDALADSARAFGIEPPRGVLILGVQGAGKSLCAKAIATAWKRPLLRLDMGALYDKFVGESERNLREALRQAEVMAPNVLWFDEIEKAFAASGQSGGGSDSGLSKRMFGMLLTWMQEHRSGVFVAATANDIDSLPPELMRKGRFDEIFFVDLPGPASRREILSIHLRKRQRDPAGFDLSALVAASEGFSGAEIEQAILAALYTAFAEGQRALTTADVIGVLSPARR